MELGLFYILLIDLITDDELGVFSSVVRVFFELFPLNRITFLWIGYPFIYTAPFLLFSKADCKAFILAAKAEYYFFSGSTVKTV